MPTWNILVQLRGRANKHGASKVKKIKYDKSWLKMFIYGSKYYKKNTLISQIEKIKDILAVKLWSNYSVIFSICLNVLLYSLLSHKGTV